MIKFFGLISKKKRIRSDEMSSIYVAALNNVISEGFVEIIDFVNNNSNLESNPNLLEKDITWFRNIVFLGNIFHLYNYFEESEASIIRGFILDDLYKELSQNEQNLAIERFLDYEKYFADLMKENEFPVDAMVFGIFEKYEINNYQGDLFKRKNKPNPIFFNELKNLLKHFIWNWEEYLEKNKLIF